MASSNRNINTLRANIEHICVVVVIIAMTQDQYRTLVRYSTSILELSAHKYTTLCTPLAMAACSQAAWRIAYFTWDVRNKDIVLFPIPGVLLCYCAAGNRRHK